MHSVETILYYWLKSNTVITEFYLADNIVKNL